MQQGVKEAVNIALSQQQLTQLATAKAETINATA